MVLPTKPPLFLNTVAASVAVAVPVWCAWFITHHPWLGMSPGVASGVVLAIWLAALVLTVRSALETPGWKAGLAAGIGSAILGLLVLGSKLVSAPEPGIAGLRPNAAIMVLGFIALGAAIGAIGGAISSALHGPAEPPTAQAVLRRLTIATVAAVVPLLIIGGLVTSTNSGMAVPDWPTTYGANMFLFPLGSHVAADVFLEHSHRLFGTLAGLATVALLLATLAHERHRGMRIFTISLFVLVLAQGALGGGRVLLGSAEAAKDKPIYAMAHGILAQIFFALLIAAWTIRSRAFADARQPEQPQGGRLARIACAALAHTTILQLVFGAMYRHFRDNHSLYTHIGFSFVVLGAAVVAASALFGVRPAGPTAARTTRRLGQAVAAIVIVQVGLGWAAFLAGSSAVRAAAPGEAILRTAHQANGAALLAVAVAAMLITRRLAPRRSA